MSDQPLLNMPGLERILHAPFLMPRWDEPNREFRRAIAIMNTIALTIDQFERGSEVHLKAAGNGFGPEANARRFTALVHFCEAEGLVPADVAANAILFRWNPIIEARGEGIDLRADDPSAYEACITAPIDMTEYLDDNDDDYAEW